MGVINDILDFSKIEAQQLEIEHIEFDIGEVKERINDLMGEKARSKGLTFVVNIQPDVPQHLVGDPLRLSQILLNFASNSVKFTEHGEVRIEVRVEKRWDDELLLKLSVIDTGIGLNPTQIKSLFQSFRQADSSVTRKYGGTGLGLVISKSLAEKMGGTTGVESTPGVGSTFWFTAKLGVGSSVNTTAAYEVPTNQMPARRGDDLLAQLKDYQGTRILLVEDNEINQLLAVELLEEAAFNVDVADHGARALEMLAQVGYALVLMDMQMAVMDGLTATREIRKNPQWADLPVIAMTANAMRSDVDNCLAAGMNDFVAKPIDPELMWAAILRWLPEKNHTGISTDSNTAQSMAEATTTAPATPATPAAPATPPPPQAFAPSLPGIDIADGLARMSNNSNFFQSILLKFTDGQSGIVQQVRSTLAAGDSETAHRLAHTLKGVSGNIGAKALAEVAKRLEDTIRNHSPQDQIERALAEVELHLTQVIQGIHAAFSPPNEAPAASFNPEQKAAPIATLRTLLNSGDADCVELFEDHQHAFKAALGENYAALAEAIESFDFDAGLATLQQFERDTPGTDR